MNEEVKSRIKEVQYALQEAAANYNGLRISTQQTEMALNRARRRLRWLLK